jgi:hypothetical protein
MNDRIPDPSTTPGSPNRWHWPCVVSAVAFSSFSAVHLIDEFLWGAPAEFHLSVQTTLFLAFAYMLAVIGLIVAASRGSSTGYLGLSLAGWLIALADVTKHAGQILAPGPWRAGLSSELVAVGLTISALAMAVTSFAAWRAARATAEGACHAARGVRRSGRAIALTSGSNSLPPHANEGG